MSPAANIAVRVYAIKREAEDINSYDLRAVGGYELPHFTAGAHIDLHLPSQLIRSYSLVNSQSERHRYVVAIARDPKSRGGSNYIHQAFKVGANLTISPPRNNFVLAENAEEIVFIAGGIGITPLYCMVQRLEALGRNWRLFYSTRTRHSCAYLADFEAMERRKPGRVNLNFDQEPGGRMYDMNNLVARMSPAAHLYCCGPAPMLEAFEKAAVGRPREQVHVEYFKARETAASGGFTVILSRSGKVLEIPQSKSILDVLLEAGMDVPFSCAEGTCGTCEVAVLEGVPDHRDALLTSTEREANNRMLICVSGSKSSRLVLDL